MHKPLLLLLLIFCSLCAKGQTTQENEEIVDTIEAAQEEVEEVYQNPREVLQYDESKVSKTPLDQNRIEEYKANDDFNYKEALPADNWWTRFKQKINDIYAAFIDWLLGGAEAVGVWAFIVEILPYLLIAGFVALIVWIFLKIDSGNLLMEKIKAPETLLSDDEALIQRPDLEQLIEQALATGNYRLAVRFYYLMVLQKMSGKDLIDWQVQKTNHDYIYELKDNALRTQFTKVTDIYDYIWYGNFDVDETAFAKAESSFKTLNSQL